MHTTGPVVCEMSVVRKGPDINVYIPSEILSTSTSDEGSKLTAFSPKPWTLILGPKDFLMEWFQYGKYLVKRVL